MIENRMKIEKQIFLGRRAIRKVLRSTQSHIRRSESPTQDDGSLQDPTIRYLSIRKSRLHFPVGPDGFLKRDAAPRHYLQDARYRQQAL